MVKFPEADARKFKNMFVCRRCKTKRKASNASIRAGKINCRNCGSDVFRPVRKK
jgi:ribosomal protein L40E